MKTITKTKGLMDELLNKGEGRALPKIGELIEGKVIYVSKNEVILDIEGLTTGVVRGKELYDESDEYSDVKIGDAVAATVMELENENGQMELSFRYAGHQKAWDSLEKLLKSGEITDAKIIDANKGGLMIKVGNVMGFLPVSQLTTEHYPRVEGGDKNKILVALKRFIGTKFRVKVIDINENEEKLIVSEKAAWEEKQQKSLSKYKLGQVVSGKITGVVDFGAFVEFDDNLEGLIHISELAWQRIDNPKEIVKVGDEIKAEIISIDDARISLSMKKLAKDPWHEVDKKYQIGQKVSGKILKINPFGAFVELDKEIHGLIHISEFDNAKINHTDLKEGDDHDFYIISIEPKEHRLGLSFKKPTTQPEAEENKEKDQKENKEKEAIAETEIKSTEPAGKV